MICPEAYTCLSKASSVGQACVPLAEQYTFLFSLLRSHVSHGLETSPWKGNRLQTHGHMAAT